MNQSVAERILNLPGTLYPEQIPLCALVHGARSMGTDGISWVDVVRYQGHVWVVDTSADYARVKNHKPEQDHDQAEQ